MGKRKLPIERIDHKRRRTVVKNKRRNGILKKAVELSMLCEQKIYMVVYDPEYDRMIQFMSDKDFGLQEVYDRIQNLKDLKTKLSLRTYTNDDFYKNFEVKVSKCETNAHQDSSDTESLDDDEIKSISVRKKKTEIKNKRKTRGRPKNSIVEEFEK